MLLELSDSKATNARLVGAQATTVSAADIISTGLKKIHTVHVTFDSDPGDANLFCSASLVNGGVGGKFTLKTWKSADGIDPTPVAASAFGKVVNWTAFGV
jgi:hypothetical protein